MQTFRMFFFSTTSDGEKRSIPFNPSILQICHNQGLQGYHLLSVSLRSFLHLIIAVSLFFHWNKAKSKEFTFKNESTLEYGIYLPLHLREPSGSYFICLSSPLLANSIFHNSLATSNLHRLSLPDVKIQGHIPHVSCNILQSIKWSYTPD